MAARRSTMAGGAILWRLDLPVFLELAAHFELGDFFTEFACGEGDEILQFTGAAAGGDGFGDFACFHTLLDQSGIEAGAVELLRLVVQIGDLIQRTQFLLRIAVAVEAPAHRVGLILQDYIHLMDITVAALAGNSAVYVSGVVEIYVVR